MGKKLKFNDDDFFVIGTNANGMRVKHHQERVNWVGLKGKTFKEICKPPSPYLNQPKKVAPSSHIQYDLDRKYLMIKNNMQLKPGQKIKRVKLHKIYGGQQEGGISTPKNSDHIFIFSDPKVGEEIGYHDGWDGKSFLYYGHGQVGDMEFERGNKAILNHKINRKRIFLFYGSKGEVTYENELTLDEKDPYKLVDSLDMKGEERQAIVFKLNPKNTYKSDLPKTSIKANQKIESEVVSEEAFETEISHREQKQKIILSSRKESILLNEYRKYREDKGLNKLKRNKININGISNWTDGWCEKERILYEAKSSSSRSYIRLAIGQLFDYQRHIKPRPKKLAILVPSKPQDDLCELLSELNIMLIYKVRKNFFEIIK